MYSSRKYEPIKLPISSSIFNSFNKERENERKKPVDVLNPTSEIQTLKNNIKALETREKETISRLNDQITTLSNKLAKRDEELENERKKSIDVTSQIQTLKNNITALEEEKTRAKATISRLNDQTTTLSNKLAKRDEEVTSLERKIAILNQNKTSEVAQVEKLSKDIIQLKSDVVKKNSEIESLAGKLEAKHVENMKLVQDLTVFEEQKSQDVTKSEIVPNLSIQMDSLLDLNRDGWKIKSTNTKEIEGKEMVTVAILGMYDVGKSWFCNEFAGKKLFNAGVTQRTDSLDCHFPAEKGNLVGIIDTPGSNEAIRCTQEDLLIKLEDGQEKNEINVETPNKPSDNTDKLMIYYKLLKNDARILQDLKEKFIREVADVLIFICNKLSEKEQETMFKVIKNHNKVKQEKMRNPAHGGGAGPRETLLYIVHNYKMLSEIDQVEKQIQRDLKDSFKIREVQLFNQAKPNLQDCNQSMFQDQFGVYHLILAAKGTNAGKYYNPSTFSFLKDRINVTEKRNSTDVKRLFLEFCNKNLSALLKQDNIRLELNSEQSAIVKVDGGPKIVLENLRYDEFGDFSVSTAFEPRYSVIERQKQSTIEIVVEMDLINSDFTATMNRDSDGYWCLFVKGSKVLTELKAGESSIRQDREKGAFDLAVRLHNSDKPKVKRDPPANGVDKTKNGVVTWVFEFELPNADIDV